jgi:dihydrofolate reductase
MLDVTLQTFLTLDGVYQAPGGSEEDAAEGFKYGGWQGPMWDADAGTKIIDEQWKETKAMLMGRKTYDIFAAYWPNSKEDPALSKLFNAIPKYVASRTMKKADWRGTTVIGANLAQEIAKAKQQGEAGIIYIPGSGNLAQSLMKQSLIDEYRLWIHPIMLGSGKRLFMDGVIPTNLKLIDTKTTGTGVVILTYRPKGN